MLNGEKCVIYTQLSRSINAEKMILIVYVQVEHLRSNIEHIFRKIITDWLISD